MCDTVVALPSVTRDGKVYFAKNSDRDPNEAQYLELVPGQEFKPGSQVECTHISIPQVEKTFTVLLSKPFWMWGAEMGVNEHSVAIGNEALFTRIPAGKEPGLIGMDLLRLALERSRNAEQALYILIDLIGRYGQSGNCSYDHQLFYHNSFLIADRNEAWVLETAGKHWAALKVKSFYSISNGITIEKNWDMASENLVKFAVDKKWCKSESDFSFKKCYSDYLYTNFSQSGKRRNDTYSFIERNQGKVDLNLLMKLMRMHSPYGEEWGPDCSLTEWTVCLHKGFGPIRASQTTGSMISRLSQEGDLHFLTATSAPCTSLYKPIWLDLNLPVSQEPIPSNHFDPKNTWWRHERFHREVLKGFTEKILLIEQRRRVIEENLVNKSLSAIGESTSKRQSIENEGFALSDNFDQSMLDEIKRSSMENQGFFHSMEWRGHNRRAGF